MIIMYNITIISVIIIQNNEIILGRLYRFSRKPSFALHKQPGPTITCPSFHFQSVLPKSVINNRMLEFTIL